MNLQRILSGINMLKDQTIHGMPLPNGWLKMSVEVGGGLNDPSYLNQIVTNLHNTLKNLSSSQGVDIYITRVDLTKPTITVICYEQKKTPEKNGVQLHGEQ